MPKQLTQNYKSENLIQMVRISIVLNGINIDDKNGYVLNITITFVVYGRYRYDRFFSEGHLPSGRRTGPVIGCRVSVGGVV